MWGGFFTRIGAEFVGTLGNLHVSCAGTRLAWCVFMPERTLPGLSRLLFLALALTLGITPRAYAQAIAEEVPPAPVVETAPPPTPAQALNSPVAAQAPVIVTADPGPVYQWNASAPPPTPVYGTPIPPSFAPRGDSLSDRAQAGEIIDLMLTSGAYGALVGNGILNWSGNDTVRSDIVTVRFGATVLGGTLSLTGLLTMDAPRGVPTVMAVGLRYGAAAGGMLAGVVGADGNEALAAMTIGGALGYGLGLGLGFGLRPHVSRTRFVEAGVFWGTSLGFLIAGAARVDSRATWGLGLGGLAAGVLSHSLVASLTNVSVGRGWLLNLGFAAPAALGALGAVTFSGPGGPSQDVTFGLAIGLGLVGLGVVFAVSDGIQDPGWVEDNEVLASLQLGFAPSADGQGGTVSVSGAF